MINLKSMGVWFITFLPAAIFLFAGLGKLVDPELWYGRFEAWGYPAWFALVIGTVEVVGAIALLIPKTVALAALVLGVDMVGATLTHFNAGEYDQMPVTLGLLAILGVLEYLHRRELREVLHLRAQPRHS